MSTSSYVSRISLFTHFTPVVFSQLTSSPSGNSAFSYPPPDPLLAPSPLPSPGSARSLASAALQGIGRKGMTPASLGPARWPRDIDDRILPLRKSPQHW